MINLKVSHIKMNMTAPCGFNCSVCLSQFRSQAACAGCNNDKERQPEYCSRCIIKNCKKRIENKYKYCFQCNTFPCKRLKQLDKRYRTRYGVSVISNLLYIKENGIRSHIREEKAKWTCAKCGALLCIHRAHCFNCATVRNIEPVK